MKLSRRTFFKVSGAAGAMTLAAAPKASASAVRVPGAEMKAVLVDTTKCVGCRACEAACAEANQLREAVMAGDEKVFAGRRSTRGGDRGKQQQLLITFFCHGSGARHRAGPV